MKYLLLTLIIMITGTIGCAEDLYYTDAPGIYETGVVEYCDDFGCREVNAPYYYVDGEVIYWDVHFGAWIGPRGYWHGGVWHRGFVGGYHNYYHGGYYHSYHGGVYRGGYHGGGFHGGGHRR